MSQLYKDLPMLAFATVAEWEEWLEANAETAKGVWMRMAKKGSAMRTINYTEARDTAICFGWIDGLINRYDDSSYLTKFTPRKAKSVWSKVNIGVAEELIASGRMRPSGLAQVEAAKADGRWHAAYDPQSTSEVSADFAAALAASPKALAFYEGLSKANKYAFLYRIQTARTPETRTARIAKYVEMLERDESFHPI